jgi:glutathione S-transferase
MAPQIPNDIILYWYPYSPYGRRVSWYLTLRGIHHASCIQPPILPRPDLEALNVNYRRIPLLSIGRDMYLDSRVIIHKLETLYPSERLGASAPEHQALERLLERWTTDAGVFSRAAQLIPTNLPSVQDGRFRKDREGFARGGFGMEEIERVRPEAVVMIRDCFALLETTILADGREWVFGGGKPSLGDIEGTS